MTDRLKIVDFFNDLIAEVDLKAETLLTKYTFKDQLKLIYERRDLFIKTIENLKKHNLQLFNDKTHDQPNLLFDKKCFILDEIKLEYSESNDENFESDIKHINDTFGYLIVFEDGDFNQTDLDLFKEIIQYATINNDQYIFKIQSKQRKQFEHETYNYKQSKIFNANINDVLKYVEVELEAIKNVTSNFVIRTNMNELFKVVCLKFFHIDFLFTVKQEAIKLFFQNPMLIVVDDTRNFQPAGHNIDIDRLITSLTQFESNLNIKSIYLYLNKIVDLRNFAPLKKLHVLNIYDHGNQFNSTVVNDHVSCLKNLRFINMGNRAPIGLNSENSFDGFIGLETLQMSAYTIAYINSSVFKGLESLKKLILSENNIRSIKRDYFKELPNLTELEISYNPISEIEEGAFSTLQCLKKLNMEHLMLNSIDEHMFDGLDNLVELRISSNNVLTIHTEAFKPLKNLRFMNYCLKSEALVDFRLFAGLINLNKLLVSTSSFKLDSITSLPSLEDLEMNDVVVGQLKPGDLKLFNQLKILKMTGKKATILQNMNSLDFGIFADQSSLEQLCVKIYLRKNIDSTTFHGLKNLKNLELCFNNIRMINSGAFDDLINLKELNLSLNSLFLLETSLFTKLACLQRLNLSGNRLTQIKSRSFVGLINLTHLDLQSNQIALLDEDAFADLNNLRYLNFSYNKITRLKKNIFKHLTNLHELILSSNQIDFIEYHAFTNELISSIDNQNQGLDQLRILDLSSNKLESLNHDQFNGLTNLENLKLNNNQITHIDSSAFDALINLKHLLLSNNKISKIDNAMFKNLAHLIYLQLNSNQIVKIRSNTFDSLINLRKLCLSINQIDLIENNSFDKLIKLTELYLSSNKIQTIDCQLFKNLEYLQHLSMDNRLTKSRSLTNTHVLLDLHHLYSEDYEQFFKN